ncbi:MAG: Poly(R)-hydroxyalkanoic acid synthase, class PhaC subunit [Pedosphaera sp.]|nr:Poly(R)-hydroxyalkanoic acid synthase, class PhaC subunit [Pedosphaera sp.]
MSENTVASNPWFQWQQAMMDEGFANMRRMSRIPFIWQKSQNIKKGATPSEVVYEEDRLKLRHYLSDAEPRYKTPLIFVFALVNRPYILDLKEGRSVVSHFVQGGFDTYLIDWGAPTHADRHLTLDDYINGYMENVIDYVRERTGSPQVNVLGYCMGGTMSAMYTALHQEKVKTLMLLAAGIDFAPRDGLLNLWTDPNYFDVDKFIDAYGNCPAEFLQTTFQMLKPVQNLIEKPINFYERAEDDKFVEDYFTMETWLNDNIAVPGEVFRQFVKCLYQKNLLVKGRMPVGKHTVNLKNITCPVLNIMAKGDDLVPCAQSAPFNDLVGSQDRKSIVVPAGHIGLAVGSKAQKEAWPEACRWLAERSD